MNTCRSQERTEDGPRGLPRGRKYVAALEQSITPSRGRRFRLFAAIRRGLLTVHSRHANNVRTGLGSSSWADEMEDMPAIRT
jgi:hypothetical protein